MTGVRPGAVLLSGAGTAAVLAVAAALIDGDLWRACAVAALLALAGYAVLTGRGRLLAAGVGLLAAATAVRHWWGDTGPAWLPGLSQSETRAELSRYWDGALARERLAAAVLLLAVVAVAAALGVRPRRAAVLPRWWTAAAALVALVPAAVVTSGVVGRWDDDLTGTDAVALAWAAAPAVAAVLVAAAAAGVATARGRVATAGAVLLGAVAAVALDAVTGAWFAGEPFRNEPAGFLEPGIMISAGGGAPRLDVDTGLAAVVLLAAAALLVAGTRPRPDAER